MTTSIHFQDRRPLQDHCGIFAVYSPQNSPSFLPALHAFKVLQTRGYDGAGFWALSEEGIEFSYKNFGMIHSVFSQKITKKYKGVRAKTWVFQNRYGTSGTSSSENIQPFQSRHLHSQDVFCVAHNGQFTKKKETDYLTTSDSVAFVESLARSRAPSWPERIISTLKKYKGAYSLIIATPQSLFVARDPLGIRPLVYGKLSKTAPFTWVIASETAALKEIGATNIKEVLPGSLLEFTSQKTLTHTPPTKSSRRAYCIFENIYLMDEKTTAHMPTKETRSIRNNKSVNLVRYQCGRILAQESPKIKQKIDFVCGIPGTGISGGQGFATELRLQYIQAIADHAMPSQEQRTFMEANVDKILQKVYEHFDIAFDMFKNKNVILVDDSLVRGNVMTGLIHILRKNTSVKKIHIKIVSPSIDKACYLGINTRQASELLAHRHQSNILKMQKEIGADSLQFLSPEGLKEAVTGNPHAKGFCLGCMTGHFPPINEYGKKIPSYSL